jgi:hypothetical protein
LLKVALSSIKLNQTLDVVLLGVCCSFLVDHKVCQEVLAGSILLDPFLVTFL